MAQIGLLTGSSTLQRFTGRGLPPFFHVVVITVVTAELLRAVRFVGHHDGKKCRCGCRLSSVPSWWRCEAARC
eukprot:956394-Pleurochrysis_carterae.AAC.1